jgi:hypothetical protein
VYQAVRAAVKVSPPAAAGKPPAVASRSTRTSLPPHGAITLKRQVTHRLTVCVTNPTATPLSVRPDPGTSRSAPSA